MGSILRFFRLLKGRYSRVSPIADGRVSESMNYILHNNRGLIPINYQFALIWSKVNNTVEIEHKQCVICMDKACDVKILPCNHSDFCQKCILLHVFYEYNDGIPRCPVCRSLFHEIRIQAMNVTVTCFCWRPMRLTKSHVDSGLIWILFFDHYWGFGPATEQTGTNYKKKLAYMIYHGLDQADYAFKDDQQHIF